MTDGTPDREALDTAQGLVAGMRSLAAEVKRLRQYGRHNRWFVVFDIALTVLLAVSGALSVHAANQASHANSAQLALCQAGNVARHQQVALWEHFYDLAAKNKLTPAQKAADEKLIAYIKSVFKPRDCAALGNKK